MKDNARYDLYMDNGHSKLGDLTSIYGLLFFFVCMHGAFEKSDLCWHNDLYRREKAESFFLQTLCKMNKILKKKLCCSILIINYSNLFFGKFSIFTELIISVI